MQVFKTTEQATSVLNQPTAIAIGNFDGVHYGHQAIIKHLILTAKHQNLTPVVLTFDPHPAQFLAPKIAPQMIQTNEQKIAYLKEFGVEHVILQNFDLDFAKQSPEDFFKTHLQKNLKAKLIMVGYDFTFGQKRSGTIETLEQLGKPAGIDIEIIPAQLLGDKLVSSSTIRRLIKAGDVSLAKDLLTRPFELTGPVIHGHNRGQNLGISTANIDPDHELLPMDGVYATLFEHGDTVYKSVSNIGFNPTFENTERSVEAHIFDFNKDIYGESVKLSFIERLRDEKRFHSPEELIEQIKKDIATTKEILKSY